MRALLSDVDLLQLSENLLYRQASVGCWCCVHQGSPRASTTVMVNLLLCEEQLSFSITELNLQFFLVLSKLAANLAKLML